MTLGRRQFMFLGAAALAGACAPSASAAQMARQKFEVTHTDAEWRKLLSPDAYEVLRHEFTETPGTSELLHEKRAGTFSCAGCDLPLFDSKTKFESGTGWPSFYQALDKAVIETKDSTLGMIRTAVNCRRCGGHLGHVFDDGPRPTGLRYCMNGVALKFTPKAAI